MTGQGVVRPPGILDVIAPMPGPRRLDEGAGSANHDLEVRA
jgi:hypothetical protein